MANPPVFKVPPAPAKKQTGERGTYDQFIKAHPTLKPYSGEIWAWANNYGGITPTQLAAVLLFESGGNKSAKSGVGALGLAQIFDNSANATNAAGVPFFRTNRTISAKDKLNPGFAIRYAAWRLSGAVSRYGSVDAAYLKDYNPGYTGSAAPISSLLPAGYVGTPAPTIDQTAGKSVATSAVTSSLKDPWIVKTDNGFKFVNATNPPAGTVQYGGQPITRSQYNQIWNQTYSDTFFAYTGRSASPNEITTILAKAPSVYSLANELAGKSGFVKSPVFKQHAPGLIGLAQTVLGNNWKPSGGIIRQAIAQNWDQATFMQHVRKLPAYQNGPEFKTNLAQNKAAYESIYGAASGDPAVLESIKAKTLAGWTPDELQAWLRDQPAYKASPEFQSKMLSLASQLGLVTGAVPTLSEDQVNRMLADNPFPAQATGPGGAPNRPDNRPGPFGPGPTTPAYPAPVRPDDRAGVRRP